MSDKFRICKDRDHSGWRLFFPRDFDMYGRASQLYDSFVHATAACIDSINRQCPTCGRGAVVDTDWGWKCEACESFDVAAGCTYPPEFGAVNA